MADPIIMKDVQSVGTLEVVTTNPTPTGEHTNAVLATLRGPFGSYIEPTRNSRRYVKDLWSRIIHSDEVREMLDTKTFYGEADHPLAYQDRLETHIPYVSHNITRLELRDDGTLYGELDVLDTPNGRLVKTLIDYGSKLGISSRGAGEVIYDDNNEPIVDPKSYLFVTFDLVVMPGARVARLTEGKISEGVNIKSAKDELVSQINEAISSKDLGALKTMNLLLESVKSDDMDKLKSQVKDVLDESESHDENSAEELLEAYSTISNLRESLSKGNDLYLDSNNKLSKLRESYSKLNSDYNSVVKELNTYKDKISSFESSSKSSLDEKDQEISRLQSALNEANNRVSKLTKSHETLNTDLNEALNTICDLKGERKELKDDIKDLKKTHLEEKYVLTDKLAKMSKLSQENEEKVKLTESKLNDVRKISEARELSILKEYTTMRCESLGIPSEVILNEMNLYSGIDFDALNESIRSKMSSTRNESLRRYTKPVKLNEVVNKTDYQTNTRSVESDDTEYLSGIASTVSIVKGV